MASGNKSRDTTGKAGEDDLPMFNDLEPYKYVTEIPTYLPKCIDQAPKILIENASRRNPFLIPKPQLGQMQFDYDIPGGSIVRVELKNGHIYEATVYINPRNDMSCKSRLKLMKAVKVQATDFYPITEQFSGVMEFDFDLVDKVYVLEYGKPRREKVTEIEMKTYVVQTHPQFQNLVDLLTKDGVHEVAFKLFGYNKGRFMDLFWIVLCIRKALIPIDMKGELNCKEVWEELKEKLFENKKILKIVYDIRYESDFLYHKVLSGIELKNVYDCQLAIFFMDTRSKYMERRRFAKKYPKAVPPPYSELILNKLSLAVTRYLGRVALEREIILLFKYESQDWTRVTHFAHRPLPHPQVLKYMALSVKYLSPLREELMTDTMRCYDMCCQKVMHHMQAATHIEAAEIVEGPSTLPEELCKAIGAYANLMTLERNRDVDPDIAAIVTGPPPESIVEPDD